MATENVTEPNVDPLERIKLEQLAGGRAARRQRHGPAGLDHRAGPHRAAGHPRPLGPAHAEDYRPLLEKLAGSLGSAEAGEPEAAGPDDPFGEPDDQLMAMLGPMIQAMQPMMVAMTAGSMVGHLARRSLGQYDLPVPRPPSDELLILVRNLDEFGSGWSLPPDDLRLWICLHEIAHHAILGVPHVRARLEALLGEYTTKFRNDPGALEDQLGDLDLTGGPESLARIQQALGEPGALLGAIQSEEQRALLPRLEAIVALVVGVVDHVMDTAGTKLIPSYGMLTEALRRRGRDGRVRPVRGAPAGPGADPGHLRPGRAFVAGIERARRRPGRLWEGEKMLPSPPEIDAPGLWLARIDLPDLPDA